MLLLRAEDTESSLHRYRILRFIFLGRKVLGISTEHQLLAPPPYLTSRVNHKLHTSYVLSQYSSTFDKGQIIIESFEIGLF